MRVSCLKIDRYGAFANLILDGLSEQLTVVQGRGRSEIALAARFLPAVLFGSRQATTLASPAHQGGEVTVDGPRGRRTIRRHVDPHGQRLTLGGDAGQLLDQRELAELLRGVTRAEFDRVFTVDQPAPQDLAALVEAAIARGISLNGSAAERLELDRRRDRLREARRQLAEIPCADASLDDLRRREDSLQREAAYLRPGRGDAGPTAEGLEQLAGEVADLEEQQDLRRRELAELDVQLEGCRREKRRLDEQSHQLRRQSESRVAEQRQRLKDIETQLDRWRKVLQDIEARRFALQSERHGAAAAGPLERPVAADPRHYLQRLESRIEGLADSVAELAGESPGQECRCRQLRTAWLPALQSLRDDVYGLCNELSRWEQRWQSSEQDSELGQLERCQAELRQAMAALAQQRRTVLAEIAEVLDIDGIVLTESHARLCRCLDHPRGVESAAPLEEAPAEDDQAARLLEEEIARLEQRRRDLLEDQARCGDALERLRERYRQRKQERDALAGAEREACLRELDTVQRQIGQLERRQQLSAEIRELEDGIEAETREAKRRSLAGQASEYLRRLSGGALDEIFLEAGQAAAVADRAGRRTVCAQLDPLQRDQVYLAVTLALVAAYGREEIRLPLLVLDSLSLLDRPGRPSAVEVLADFARSGHQLLVFTWQPELAAAFQAQGAAIRTLAPAVVRAELPAPAPLAEQRREELNQQLNALADEAVRQDVRGSSWSSEEFPGELTDRVQPARRPAPAPRRDEEQSAHADEYFLSADSPIQEAPSVDAATAERFRKVGVMTIRDLLQVDVEQTAGRLRYAGISSAMIRRWQAEALLVCRVRRLRPYDARILVACGVTSPEQLGRLEAEELRRRVERFSSSSLGQVLLRAGNPYELSRLTEWILSARGPVRYVPAHVASLVPSGEANPVLHTAPPRPLPRRHPRAPADTTRAAGPPVLLKMGENDRTLRFYLELNDSVERAPAIGPRTAARLEAVGIRTIAELLSADPAALARRLKRLRLKPDYVRRWQQQSILAVRIPWLRGHDAQILVACGASDPEAIAQMDAESLWKKVKPFCRTSQGRRVLRSGKAPDLEEIRRWIRWAGQSRQLRAA